MHGCLDNGSLATSSYLRNANIKTYVEERTELSITCCSGASGGSLLITYVESCMSLISLFLYSTSTGCTHIGTYAYCTIQYPFILRYLGIRDTVRSDYAFSVNSKLTDA